MADIEAEVMIEGVCYTFEARHKEDGYEIYYYDCSDVVFMRNVDIVVVALDAAHRKGMN